MKRYTLYILCLLASITFGCETTINPQLDAPERVMVIDAWVNQKMERQEIKITRSQPYFENSAPAKVSGATVAIEDLDNGTIYNFQEGDDAYFWEPSSTPLGVAGHHYRLTVTINGETFEAHSSLGRVPAIDTIKYHHNPADFLIKQEHYKAEFVAKDPVGTGDVYWIKTWRNGAFLGKPSEVNIAYDAGFTNSQTVDGQVFNLFIRQDLLNPLDRVPDKQNEFLPPYVAGDSVHVEIHSINPAAFDFLWGVFFHANRPGGFAELFSTPLANVPTNLKSLDANSTTNIAGFFTVSAVSSKGQKLTQEIANQAKRQ